MPNEREVVILSGVRTAIGDYGGSLKDIPPTDLAAKVVREAVSRAKIDPAAIGQCVFGNVIHTEAKDMYLSRVAAINGGLPNETGALTLNRLCGSGMQAIVSASQYILLGDIDASIASGFLPPAPAKDACGICDYRIVCGPYEERRLGKKDRRDVRLEHLTEIRGMA